VYYFKANNVLTGCEPQSHRREGSYFDISKHVGRVNSESIVVDEIAA
jgi:hypothetical protein